MIRTIVFDMDGVLIDTEALILEAWKEVAAGIGLKDIENLISVHRDYRAGDRGSLSAHLRRGFSLSEV